MPQRHQKPRKQQDPGSALIHERAEEQAHGLGQNSASNLIPEQNHGFSTGFLRASLVYTRRMCCNMDSRCLSCVWDGFQPAGAGGSCGCSRRAVGWHSSSPTMARVRQGFVPVYTAEKHACHRYLCIWKLLSRAKIPLNL